MSIKYWDMRTEKCLAVIEQSDIVYTVPRIGDTVRFGHSSYTVWKITHDYTSGAPDELGCFTIVGDEEINVHVMKQISGLL